MQKAGKSIMLILTKAVTAANTATTYTEKETNSKSISLFPLSEREGMTRAYNDRGGENIFLPGIHVPSKKNFAEIVSKSLKTEYRSAKSKYR